jgi:leucyl/phenylalanyl-tRNA--protein transferase
VVFQLTEKLIFPDPDLAEDNGLLAVGGDLSEARLLLAYKNGIFPWYSEYEPILWYAPKERFVLFSEKIKVSRSMQKLIASELYSVTINHAFERVIEKCAAVKRTGQRGTWITDDMKKAYCALNKSGYAFSIEVWRDKELVGGLYGVRLGKLFCGESMFHEAPNTSKIALIYLAKNMGVDLIGCQVHTNHLESMGAEMISFNDYRKWLKKIII